MHLPNGSLEQAQSVEGRVNQPGLFTSGEEAGEGGLGWVSRARKVLTSGTLHSPSELFPCALLGVCSSAP